MPDLSIFGINTDRLQLVPCNSDHLDGLTSINSDPEVMRYLGRRLGKAIA